MAARRGASRGMLRTSLFFAGLGVVGFGIGIAAGVLWEEPGLVIAYLTGRTQDVPWDASAPPWEESPEAPEAAPPAVAAAPPAAPARAVPAAPKRPAAPPPVAAPAPGHVAIQVGAFGESEAAEALAQRLREVGYSVYVTPGATAGQARWRVRVGPFASREQAEELAGKLKREQRLPTWVLDEDNG